MTTQEVAAGGVETASSGRCSSPTQESVRTQGGLCVPEGARAHRNTKGAQTRTFRRFHAIVPTLFAVGFVGVLCACVLIGAAGSAIPPVIFAGVGLAVVALGALVLLGVIT